MKWTGSRREISEDIGSRGMRSAADRYSLRMVDSRLGTYVSIWSASSWESQNAPPMARSALC